MGETIQKNKYVAEVGSRAIKILELSIKTERLRMCILHRRRSSEKTHCLHALSGTEMREKESE